jgi:uncharacterized glyoxalase superfamily protein PhnB
MNAAEQDPLRCTEIKAFVPAQDFERSKAFYRDIGFTMASDGDGIAYFHHGNCSFMMHLLVADVDAWHAAVTKADVVARYGVKLGPVELQPWRMRDFVLTDPCGVLWRVGQNVS